MFFWKTNLDEMPHQLAVEKAITTSDNNVVENDFKVTDSILMRGNLLTVSSFVACRMALLQVYFTSLHGCNWLAHKRCRISTTCHSVAKECLMICIYVYRWTGKSVELWIAREQTSEAQSNRNSSWVSLAWEGSQSEIEPWNFLGHLRDVWFGEKLL